MGRRRHPSHDRGAEGHGRTGQVTEVQRTFYTRRTNMKFQVHTKETAPEASRVTLEATGKKYGFVPNLFGVLAESPTAVQAYAAINKALEQSALSPAEQQVVALT